MQRTTRWSPAILRNWARSKPLAFAADAGFAMGLQLIFALKPLSEAGFAENSSDGWICFPERFARRWPDRTPKTDFLASAYEAGTSNAPSFEHAVASAAQVWSAVGAHGGQSLHYRSWAKPYTSAQATQETSLHFSLVNTAATDAITGKNYKKTGYAGCIANLCWLN